MVVYLILPDHRISILVFSYQPQIMSQISQYNVFSLMVNVVNNLITPSTPRYFKLILNMPDWSLGLHLNWMNQITLLFIMKASPGLQYTYKYYLESYLCMNLYSKNSVRCFLRPINTFPCL